MLTSPKKDWKTFTTNNVLLSDVLTMISSTTPYKLAEIIRDTWYNLYTPTKYNQIHKQLILKEKPNDEQV